MKSNVKKQPIIIIILGITFTLFPIIFNNLNFNVGTSNKSLVKSDNISFNKKSLKTSQNQVLYSENFDDGIADNWDTIGGTWIVENKTYKATGTPGERVRSYYVNQSFSYYIYEGDFTLVSGNEMQIIFNIQDIFPGVDQGHYCQITLFYDDPYGRKDTAVIYSTQNGQTEHNNTVYDFTHNQWYHFSIISTGAAVEFYLDNSLVLSYSGLFYSSGYIGVKSMYGPTAYWDNIKVSGLNNSRKIHIDGNSDWITYKNAVNCSGNGTYSDPYVIEDLVINARSLGSCILIENSDVYFRIENCTLYNPGRAVDNSGIKLYNIDNGQLFNNTLTSENGAYGIFLEDSNNNSIMGNIIDNIIWGIRLLHSHNNSVSRNVQNNGNTGIDLEHSFNNIISRNIANKNGYAGIFLEDSDDNTFLGNTVNYNNYGIRLIGCDKNNISGNIACYNGEGIRFYGSFNNIISRNTANNNWDGIYFWYGNNYNKISENNVSNNYWAGIMFLGSSCDNNNISGNIANNNQMYGICLAGSNSDSNNILGNTANNNNIGIKLTNNDKNLISGNVVNNNSNYGIYLVKSNNNIITFNVITNNNFGIYLYNSYSNEISNNTYSGNNVDVQIYNDPKFTFEIVVIVIVIIIAMVIAGMLLLRKRVSRPRTKTFPFEKYREKYQVGEKPTREIILEPETKSELKISPELYKVEVKQEGVIPSSPEEKPEELEIVQEEEVVVSALEELEIMQEEEVVSDLEEIPIEEDIPPEEIVVSTPEEQPEELEIIQTEEVVSDLEEIPIEEDIPPEEIVVSTPEEQPEELIPPEPQIIKCPFCGKENSKGATFYHQCGMIFKNK